MDVLVASQEYGQVPEYLMEPKPRNVILRPLNDSTANDTNEERPNHPTSNPPSFLHDELFIDENSSEIIGGDEVDTASFLFHSKLQIHDQEEAELLDAYRRLSCPEESNATTEFVFISGPTGVGKTTLAQSIRDKVMSDGGFFCQGKFDSLQSHEPYAAFVSAFTEFTQIVVDRGDEAIAAMRDSILAAVGSEGKVLTDTIPAIARILGNQGERSNTLPTTDVFNQFKSLFRMFLRAVCSPQQPLVLLLDDIHWADESSSLLLHSLVSEVAKQGILFIATVRNDVIPCRKFEENLDHLRKSNVRVTGIKLQNLQDEAVRRLLSQLLASQKIKFRRLPVSYTVKPRETSSSSWKCWNHCRTTGF
jgi:energy-coupling factor transporter ATP-binding protein EcfA2